MRPYSQRALELKLFLEAGVISPDEVIEWADQTLATNSYDDSLAELAITSNVTSKNLIILLGHLVDQADEWSAIRVTMSKMHDALLADSSLTHSFTRFLESFWGQHDYDVPSDMNFIAGIEDEYQLAEIGSYGTIPEVTQSLIDHLSKYKNTTEQGAAANP
jgi:hypothetical protein